MRLNEKAIRQHHEKRMDTRKRTDTEFLNSLEIVKDSKKIKNIRPRMGYTYRDEDLEAYGRNYERIFGRSGAKPGGTGRYKWDEKQKKLVKVSDRVPSSKLVTL